jgi:DNA polymerase I-like protein with 3'-5' exonuclease and polymerase domains
VILDLPNVPWAVVDTETSGGHPDDGARVACVALAHTYEDGSMWSVGLPFDQGERDKFPNPQLGLNLFGEQVDPNLPEEAWIELLDWLARTPLVFHNAKFDLQLLRVGTRHWAGRCLIRMLLWDTMVAQRIMDPTHDVGLDVTLKRLGLGAKVGLDGVKGWLKGHKYPTHRYDLVPWEIIEQYVIADAENTAVLYRRQLDRLATGDHRGGPDAVERIAREWGLLRTLYAMENRGVGYDAEESLRAAEILEADADRIEATMPFQVNPKSAHAYFFGKLHLIADRMTDGGKPSLDMQQVRDWIKEGVPYAEEYAEVTKKRRAVSMWYRGYPEKLGHDGRLRTSYKQTRVKSGRMSVGRVQLQAMPKSDKGFENIPQIRKLVVPAEGMGLWNLDLSQAELRVASIYSRCRRMLDMLEQGIDQHGATCEAVLRVKKEELDPVEWKVKRDIAKRLNFSGIFQIGPDHFQHILAKMADLHLELDECKDIVYGWRNMYPEFGVAYKRADKKASTERFVRIMPNTPYEFQSWFAPTDFPNTAWNRIVQGSLAEFFKLWMIEVEKRWPGYLLLTVHDSLLLEAKPDEGQHLSEEVAAWGAETASNLFGIEMKVDIDRW